MSLEVEYLEVGRASVAWDDQSSDLRAASGQIGDADFSGLTPAVRAAAAAWRRAWVENVDLLATDAEERADGLREALNDYVDSDDYSFQAYDPRHLELLGYLEERR